MAQKVTQQIGTLTVEVEGAGPKEIIEQLAFYGSLPSVCPFPFAGEEVCGHALQLTFKVVTPKQGKFAGKPLKYYGMRCSNLPAHTCNFGQRMDDGSVFYKGPESFVLDHKARQYEESGGGHDEDDDYNQNGAGRHDPPPPPPRDDFNEPPQSAPTWVDKTPPAPQPPATTGATPAQRTMLSKLLKDKGMSIEEAYKATGASRTIEEMNVGQVARFITAVGQLTREAKF